MDILRRKACRAHLLHRPDKGGISHRGLGIVGVGGVDEMGKDPCHLHMGQRFQKREELRQLRAGADADAVHPGVDLDLHPGDHALLRRGLFRGKGVFPAEHRQQQAMLYRIGHGVSGRGAEKHDVRRRKARLPQGDPLAGLGHRQHPCPHVIHRKIRHGRKADAVSVGLHHGDDPPLSRRGLHLAPAFLHFPEIHFQIRIVGPDLHPAHSFSLSCRFLYHTPFLPVFQHQNRENRIFGVESEKQSVYNRQLENISERKEPDHV